MMARGILGKKLGMTQIFEADGTLVPVTVVEAGPCMVLANKTEETDAITPFSSDLVISKKNTLINP